MTHSPITLQTLKGFRDFLPEQKRKREYVLSKIKLVFELHGFEPLETPTLEYASVLQGKYGEEADKLIYTFEDRGKRMVGLRYDQTVPTARVLAQYGHKLPRYFRRYQVQNVFRAENTQAGRYRELLQCDCDIFGSPSPLADAELLSVMYQAYRALGFQEVTLVVNDRQILFDTLTPFATSEVTVNSIIQSIDKLDKIHQEGVLNELVSKGISQDNAHILLDRLIAAPMTPVLSEIVKLATFLGVPEKSLLFSPHLARGLDYYTGLIVEAKIPAYAHGSVGGGGRYDHLIQDLGGPEIPAVGFAIGFDRTIEALETLGLLPEMSSTAQVLVTIFDASLQEQSLEVARIAREKGIAVEVYPAYDKLGKQLKYADDKKIPYVIVIGPDESKAGEVLLKNMKTGEEKRLMPRDLTESIIQSVM